MPAVTSTGFIDGITVGFTFLKYNRNSIGLAFSGTVLPSLLEVGFYNDEGAFVPFTNGAITTFPTTLIVDSVPAGGIAVNVSGGSPDFNLSYAGDAGPLS